jgi:hypothetical protein
VDYAPEAIDAARRELVALRDSALGEAEFTWAVLLSHVIAYLADYRDLLAEDQDSGRAEHNLRAIKEDLLGLAGAWEHQDRYFPSGPQYAVDLRAAIGRHITEEGA